MKRTANEGRMNRGWNHWIGTALGNLRRRGLLRRVVALGLLVLFLQQQGVALMQPLHAETAGATAPEVTKFEPVDTTDMVNLASGDFTYNIPIINVPGPEGGYPLALNYHSGIQHGEEASWVGLGWGLQPGSIARSVRGYPDDFFDVPITKQFGSSSTYEYSVGVSWAHVVGVGVTYNTSKGFGGYVSLGLQEGGATVGVTAHYYGGGDWSVGVGVTMANGIGAEVSYSSSGSVGVGVSVGDKDTGRLGLSANTDAHGSTTVGMSASMAQGVNMSWSSSGASSIGVADQKSGGAISFSSYSGGGMQQDFIGGFIPLPCGFSIDFGRTEYWIDKTEYEHGYGYFNHHVQNGIDLRVNEWIMESDPKAIPGDDPQKSLGTGFNYLPSYDNYTVMGQGTGGAIRPTRLHDWVYHPKRVDDKWKECMDWPWPDANGFAQTDPRFQARFVFDGDNTEVLPADSLNLNRMGITARGGDGQSGLKGQVPNLDNPASMVTNPLVADIQGVLPQNGGLQIGAFNSSAADPLYLSKSYRAKGGSRVVNPLFGSVYPDNHTFMGFDIWEVDGKRYLYREAVLNRWSESVAGDHYDRSGDWFRSRTTIDQPYAYAWYLSELRYPDYYDADTTAGPSDGDLGGWVKFGYLLGAQDYRWHTSSDGEFNDGPVNRVHEVGQKKAGMMYSMEYGAKQLKYPLSIETATHKAFFSTSPRLDAREVGYNPQVFDSNFSDGVQHPSFPRGQQVNLTKISADEYEIWFDETQAITYNYTNTNPAPMYSPALAALGFLVDVYRLPAQSSPWSVVQFSTASSSYNNIHVGGTTATSSVTAAYDGAKTSTIISLQGVPILVSGVNISTNNSTTWATDHDFGDAKHTSISLKYHASVRFHLTGQGGQFWGAGQTTLSSPSAFSNLRDAWNSLSLGAQANGGKITLSPPAMLKLDDIYLVEKSTNRLVKQVHFEYSYDLCQGTPNSGAPPLYPAQTSTGGKLTLKSVQVFGEDGMGASNTTKLPPYRFYYGNNPNYVSKYAYDRWGFHKSNGAMWQHRDVVPGDQDAWCMSRVQVPTGGNLYIQYEPKDYARVQDRRPQNASANRGMVGNYEVDLPGWLKKLGLSAWPVTQTDWNTFLAGAGTTPLQSFAPSGDTDSTGAAVPKATTSLPQQTFAPWDSAPVPKDLVAWWKKNQAFTALQSSAAAKLNITSSPTSGSGKALMPALAVQSGALPTTQDVIRNTRMINLVFEYFTAGNAGTSTHRRLSYPLDELKAGDVGNRTPEDRRMAQTFSVLALMTTDTTTNRTNIMVIDPDFRWPKKAPNALYVTWTHPAAKVGGGVRVKRIVSNDGRRSYATTYSYQDVVDGEWTTSGVAVTEPPPYGYSSDDDRVIFPEFGGWANERSGGIIHSRVIVRHSWNENAAPAGTPDPTTSTNVEIPGGESVFRFISPADLPHRVSDGGYASTDTGGNYRRVKVTEIFNMGAWWGQLLWRENRDAKGRPMQRSENRYTQLDGYLRSFPRAISSDGVPLGTDTDVEYQFQANNAPSPLRRNQSYDWAEKYTNSGDRVLPALIDNTVGNVSDQTFSKATSGYLNASLNVTLAYRTDYGSMSSIDLVRELNLRPLLSETRTYAEGASTPTTAKKNMVWEARTGQVLEARTKGRTSPVGTPANPNEWLISRSWPAYWAYPGMFKRDDSQAGYGMPMSSAESFAVGVTNLLGQTTQSTISRQVPGATTENYLNSKIETWWQAPGGYTQRWLKGGDFVWNGSGSVPPSFDGYPAKDNWTPASVADTTGGYQPYKAKGWLFAGAATGYDAYGHALEAVESDGVFGCSKFGYHSTAGLLGTLPAGLLPIAKFANARDAETIYINFEDPVKLSDGTLIPRGDKVMVSDDPLARLGTAYSGEVASSAALTLKVPTSTSVSQFELRYYVKAANAAAAQATYPNAGEVVNTTPAEGGWWLVRAKVAAGQSRTFGGGGTFIDDVSVFPWRRNGAPASVSHYAYDRALGLVTSITGANGRTMRYRYDKLGRLMTVYDPYGNPSRSTRYYHMNQ